MRELATLPSADAAQTLADYLLTLRIETKVERQPNGWAVWVRDEDQVARARQELDEFNRNPNDPRYSAAAREADALRRQKASAEKAYHRRSRYSPGLPTMYAHQRQLASKLRELSRATRQRIEPRPSFAELTKPPSKPKPARTQDPQDADTDEIKQQDPPQLDAWPRRPGV